MIRRGEYGSRFKNSYEPLPQEHQFLPRERGEWVTLILKNRIAQLIIICVVLVLGYTSLVSRFFKVNNFIVQGTIISDASSIKLLAESRVDKRRFIVFKESSLLFYSRKGLENDILKKYPVQGVVVTRDFPHTVVVTIQEVSPVVIANVTMVPVVSTSTALLLEENGSSGATLTKEAIATTSLSLLVSNEGRIIKKIEGEDYTHYAVATIDMTIHHGIEGVKGEVILNPQVMSFILGVDTAWKDKMKLTVDRYRYDDTKPGEIGIQVGEGWVAILSRLNSITDQLYTLQVVLNEKFAAPQSRKAIQYIDLKIPDKVYWK